MKVVLLFLSLFVAAWAQDVPCGVPVVQPIHSRIVGGVSAKQGSWPWMVMIVDAFGHIRGSGAIVNPNVVITSAQHFVHIHTSIFDLNLHQWRIYAGKHNISTTDINEHYHHMRRVIVHPHYNAATLENDVALIFTVETIQWNDHTRPICIPDDSHQYATGDTCYLAGWGSTSFTGDEEVLNQVSYPIIDDSVCSHTYRYFVNQTQICSGYENQHKDFCGADVGSPLVCKHSSGVWYSQGIASGGGNCTTADHPGIFTDVKMYSSWIEQTMSDAGYPYEY